MGIKGIYGEIGPGQRVALTKLAIDNFENTGRPLRIAVDVSIWQFQIQSGKGGSNPALRTLYYRLLRLLSMSIQPLFVFDGSQKPPFKRNKRMGAAGPSLADFNTKQLLKLFGFPFHIAPGEAEAECALLQREDLVDAVLSEDVDTLMFGCGRTFRNWSNEGSRGNQAPTHVTVYDGKATHEGKSNLDREGMILVALMSGGDYITEGVPGCGIKVACEAAKAGFGKSLCRLARTDTTGLNKWREDLVHELQTNESKHFRIKHKALRIPETFPNREVLGYYTHPVVSSATKITKMKEGMEWNGEVDVAGLRFFVAEAFGWTHKIGAKKFIRGLAPALLASKVRERANRRASGFDDTVYTAMNEIGLVKEICGKRQHFSTDGIPELCLLYHPANIVGLDLETEVDEIEDYGRNGLAPLGKDDNPQTYRSEDESDGNSRTISRSSTKRNAANYDPTELQKIWIPETIAKAGIPLMVEDYEETLRNPRRPNKSKTVAKGAATKGGMRKGALDRYVSIVQPATEAQNHQSPKKLRSALQNLPPAYLAPALNGSSTSCISTPSRGNQSQELPPNKSNSKSRARPATMTEDSKSRSGTQKKGLTPGNPWIVAQSSSPGSQKPYLSRVHISKPGLNVEKKSIFRQYRKAITEEVNIGQDFNKSLPSSPSPFRKHSRPISASSNADTSSEYLKDSHLLSPTKKRIPTPPIKLKVPVAVTKQTKAAVQEVIDISSSPMPASRSALASINHTESSATEAVQEPNEVKEGNSKRILMLRESLEGAWKAIGEVEWKPGNERARGRAWRASAVEVLDMTGD